MQAYPGRLARLVESRREAVASARADPSWGRWAWTPTREELQAYVGEFESARLEWMNVRLGPDGLEAWLGAMRMPLTPAREGLFGERGSEIEAPETFQFRSQAESIEWTKWRFYLVPLSAGKPRAQ